MGFSGLQLSQRIINVGFSLPKKNTNLLKPKCGYQVIKEAERKLQAPKTQPVRQVTGSIR